MDLPGEPAGALVAMVAPGSAAEHAGLKAGDVITAIDTTPVRGASDVRNRIGLLRVGDVAELTVQRGKRSLVLHGTLTAPATNLVQGSSASPLLDGADFGLVGPSAPVKGVEIVSVRAGSTAWEAGLRQGDIITSVNLQPVANPDQLAARAKGSPQRMLLNLIRDGGAVFIALQ